MFETCQKCDKLFWNSCVYLLSRKKNSWQYRELSQRSRKIKEHQKYSFAGFNMYTLHCPVQSIMQSAPFSTPLYISIQSNHITNPRFNVNDFLVGEIASHVHLLMTCLWKSSCKSDTVPHFIGDLTQKEGCEPANFYHAWRFFTR